MSYTLQSAGPISARIREAAARGTLSHALLFTGSGDRLSAARYAAAAFQCTGEGDRPCGVCNGCRKVLSDIHPDVITVRDPDHKNIAVDVVRQIRSDAYIRPNEGTRKVYLFPDCALLTEQDQNVLLKIVEEGPPYASFLFCAENPAVVLQTLRSRSVEWKLRPTEQKSGEHLETAALLCQAIGERKRGAVTEAAVCLEKRRLSREELSSTLERSRAIFAAALLRLYGKPPQEADKEVSAFLTGCLTKTALMRIIEILEKYRAECVYNVGPSHVLGALAVELEGIV